MDVFTGFNFDDHQPPVIVGGQEIQDAAIAGGELRSLTI